MKKYYSAKCYFSFPEITNEEGEIGYEQRIVLLRASDENEALLHAEEEAKKYAKANSANFLEFIEVFSLFEFNGTLDGISEVYSITMYDDPDEDEFINNYYLTGGNARVMSW